MTSWWFRFGDGLFDDSFHVLGTDGLVDDTFFVLGIGDHTIRIIIMY